MQEDSAQESLGTDMQKHCIRRQPESGVMPHNTALDNHQLQFRHLVQHTLKQIHVLSARLTSCKPGLSLENVLVPS